MSRDEARHAGFLNKAMSGAPSWRVLRQALGTGGATPAPRRAAAAAFARAPRHAPLRAAHAHAAPRRAAGARRPARTPPPFPSFPLFLPAHDICLAHVPMV
jgi:hypothetical protein